LSKPVIIANVTFSLYLIGFASDRRIRTILTGTLLIDTKQIKDIHLSSSISYQFAKFDDISKKTYNHYYFTSKKKRKEVYLFAKYFKEKTLNI
jgi:hypothetical protein